MLEEQRLDTALHDCATFDCGALALNEYLAKFADLESGRVQGIPLEETLAKARAIVSVPRFDG